MSSQVIQEGEAQSSCVLCWVAVALFAYPLFKLVIFLAITFIKQIIPFPNLLHRYCSTTKESWAVVTGATDGIGLGFCQVLTNLGFNIVLISRNQQKLQDTVAKLAAMRPKQHANAKLKTIAFDFKDSSDHTKFYKVHNQLKGLDIAVLVNNVGTSTMNLFHNSTFEQIIDVININCVSMSIVTADVLKIMEKRTEKSAIINLSSYMGESALPFLTLYSATKAFNMKFSEGIAFQHPQIDVMCLKPMFVESPLSQQKKGFAVPDRRECAYDALKQLRWEHESYGYFSHRIIGYCARQLIPTSLYNWGVSYFSRKAIKRLFPDAKVN